MMAAPVALARLEALATRGTPLPAAVRAEQVLELLALKASAQMATYCCEVLLVVPVLVDSLQAQHILVVMAGLRILAVVVRRLSLLQPQMETLAGSTAAAEAARYV